MPSQECIHYWEIKPAAGPTSKGRCRKCEEVRNFQNSIPYIDYMDRRNKPDHDAAMERLAMEGF